jgi:hypothetical protein
MKRVQILFLVFFALSLSGCDSRIYKMVKSLATADITTEFFGLEGLQTEVYIAAPPEDVFRFMQDTEKVQKVLPHMHISLEPEDPKILEKPGDTYHVQFYFWVGKVPGLFVLTKFEQPAKLQGFVLSRTWMRLEVEFLPEGSGTRMRQRTIIEVPKGFSTFTRFEMGMVSWRNRRFASLIGQMMNTEAHYEPAGTKLFSIICNIHRAMVVVDSPPDQIWKKVTQVDFLNQALAPFAYLKTSSPSLKARGDWATIVPKDSARGISIKAVAVNIEPEKEAHLCLFIDEINAGVLFRLRPREGRTEVECLFYYEVPSDYLMNTEQILLLSEVDEKLRIFLDNLKQDPTLRAP